MIKSRPDIKGAIGSGLMVIIGATAIWAARDYSDLGAVFPRSVGALLVALGSIYIVMVFRGRTHQEAAINGSSLRRALAAIVMLVWGFSLGPLGFLPTGVAAMSALLLIANHDRWTLRTAIIYGLSTSIVISLLYSLFKYVLQVPLP